MRLLVLGLLAVGTAQGYSVNYRSLLQGYAPARGEFAAARDAFSQGYLRYQDSTGAERLIAVNYDTFQQKVSKEDQLLQLRAWCEQRYNVMRMELERLRAEGKQPPAKILAQYEQLDKLIKSNAFEPVPVPGLSPEVQRARDEHLRIWNDARLQVLQAEAEQAAAWPQTAELRISQSAQAQPQPLLKLPQAEKLLINPQLKPQPQLQSPPQPALQSPPQPQPYLPLEAPKPVQETAEVLRAREEHLRRFNEALQAQQTVDRVQPSDVSIQKQPNPFIKNFITPQSPQPVEETPEVKRAREEHLKQYNEALQRRREPQPQEQPQPEAISANPQPQAQPQPQPEAAIPASPQAPIPAPIPAAIPDPIPTPSQAPFPAPIQANPQPIQASLQALTLPASLTQPLKQLLPEPLVPLPTAAPKTYTIAPATTVDIREPAEPIAPLPMATIKSSIPAYEQQIQLLNQAKLMAQDRLADIDDKIYFEEREREAEHFRELELRRKEQEQAELEQQQEAQRLTEERRLLEAERVALLLQEQQRLEKDLQEDSQRLQAEQKFSFVIGQKPAEESSSGGSVKLAPSKPQAVAASPPQPQPQAIAQQQQVQNGFFLRIQSAQPASTVGEGYLLAEHTQNPFLLRYVQQPQAQPLVQPLGQFKVIPGPGRPHPSPISTPTTGYIPTSNGISELEKATREHFKAHELALEQLRLANLKDVSSVPTPCQH